MSSWRTSPNVEAVHDVQNADPGTPVGACTTSCHAQREMVLTSSPGHDPSMGLLLTVLAAILAIVGVLQLIQGQIVFGIILLIVAALVGPGGYSIFGRRA